MFGALERRISTRGRQPMSAWLVQSGVDPMSAHPSTGSTGETRAQRLSSFRVFCDECLSALRAVLATPRYSLPAVVTLALGIGAATGVYSVAHAVLLRPLPFERGEELVRVFASFPAPDEPGGAGLGLSVPFAEDFEASPVFRSFAAFRQSEVMVADEAGGRRAAAAMVTSAFFDTLAPRFLMGHGFVARDTAAASGVVVSESFWRSALGARPVLGGKLVVDGEARAVLGVVESESTYPVVDLWLGIHFSAAERATRFMTSLTGLGRLAPGLSFEQAALGLEAEVEARRIEPPGGGGGRFVTAELTPLRRVLAGNKAAVMELLGAAVVVFLLLAQANVTALLVTRASVRSAELSLRSALGQSRLSLVRQSALEVLWLALFGGGLGIGICALMIRVANRWWQGGLDLTPARLNGSVLAMGLGLTLLSALSVGIAPALFARRVRPMAVLRAAGGSSSSRGARRLRELLVAVQIGASVALLGNAVLIMRSVHELRAVDPGYDTNAVVLRVLYPPARRQDGQPSWHVPDARSERLVRELGHRLGHHLNARFDAALASDVPFDGGGPGLGFELPRGSAAAQLQAKVHLAGPGFFRTLGIPIVAGRDFTDSDLERRDALIINRSFATDAFGSPERALGQRVNARGWPDPHRESVEVVGVVEDTLDQELWRQPTRDAFAPFTSEFRMHGESFAVVARGPGDAGALLDIARRLVHDVNPDVSVYGGDVLGALNARSYWQQSALTRVLGLFAAAALALAAVGVFGVTSYSVAERSREIGIRRALGSSQLGIFGLIARETAWITALGVAFGFGAAYGSRWLLASFLFHVEGEGLWVYASVSTAVALVALGASLSGAAPAARVSPSRALLR
jgi:putative ABC transport system permease protein